MACVAAITMSAQDILMSAPRDPVLPALLREHEPPTPASQPPAPPDTPFKFGRLVLHPHLSYGYMYAEGLPAPNGQRVPSENHTLSAGLSAELGEHWSLNYTPTWMYYSSRAMEDSFDQSAMVSGAFAFGGWGLQFSESYAQATPTLVETGQQTKQESWVSSLSTGYTFSPSVQFQASASMSERYTDIANDTRTWTTSTSVSWVFNPRLTLSLSPGFTYTEVIDAPDTYSESYNARLSWRPTDKLTVGCGTGTQYTHSTSSSGVDLSDPLLNFSLGYQPFEATSVTISATQTVTPSYFNDQVTKSFRWSVGLNQRFLGRFYFNASYAPYDTNYIATDTLTEAGRKDSVKSYTAGLSTQVLRRISISATFSLTDNKSNDSKFSFSTKQYGIQVGCSF